MENYFLGNICRGLPVRGAGVFMRLFARGICSTESFALGISFDGTSRKHKKPERIILRATSIIHFHIQFPVAVVMAPVIAVAPIARPNTVNIKPAILFLL